MSGEVVEGSVPCLDPEWVIEVDAGISSHSLLEHENAVFLGLESGHLVKIGLKGEALGQWAICKNAILSMSIDSRKRVIALGDEGGGLTFFDLTLDRIVGFHSWPHLWLEHLAWDGDRVYVAAGKAVFSVSLQPNAKPWRVAEIPSSATSLQLLNAGTVVVTHYGGASLISSSLDKKVLPWKGSLISLALPSTAAYVVAGTQELSIHLWDLASGKDMEMRGFQGKVRNLEFHHLGQFLATAAANELVIWDFSGAGPAGKAPLVLGPLASSISALRFQPQGDRLLTSDGSGAVLVWEPFRSEVPIFLSGMRDQPVNALSWVSKGQAWVTALKSGYFALYANPDR
jgi:WD40 repeat protein